MGHQAWTIYKHSSYSTLPLYTFIYHFIIYMYTKWYLYNYLFHPGCSHQSTRHFVPWQRLPAVLCSWNHSKSPLLCFYVCSSHVWELWLVEKIWLSQSPLCWELEWDASSTYYGSNYYNLLSLPSLSQVSIFTFSTFHRRSWVEMLGGLTASLLNILQSCIISWLFSCTLWAPEWHVSINNTYLFYSFNLNHHGRNIDFHLFSHRSSFWMCGDPCLWNLWQIYQGKRR